MDDTKSFGPFLYEDKFYVFRQTGGCPIRTYQATDPSDKWVQIETPSSLREIDWPVDDISMSSSGKFIACWIGQRLDMERSDDG